jgi:hypothetical protein
MAMRIYAGVGDRGFDPFTTWSKRWEYYNDTTGPAEDLKCWQEVQGSPPDRTGINKIFKIARENGWVPRLRETAPSSADEIIFTADAARNEVQLLVRDFLERRVACPESERDAWIDVYFEQRDPDWPSVKAMLVPTGVGKTRITIQELAAWISRSHDQGAHHLRGTAAQAQRRDREPIRCKNTVRRRAIV